MARHLTSWRTIRAATACCRKSSAALLAAVSSAASGRSLGWHDPNATLPFVTELHPCPTNRCPRKLNQAPFSCGCGRSYPANTLACWPSPPCGHEATAVALARCAAACSVLLAPPATVRASAWRRPRPRRCAHCTVELLNSDPCCCSSGAPLVVSPAWDAAQLECHRDVFGAGRGSARSPMKRAEGRKGGVDRTPNHDGRTSADEARSGGGVYSAGRDVSRSRCVDRDV